MNTPKRNRKRRSAELQARIDKTRADAHKEIVSAGKIQFRLDAKNMELLISISDERCIGPGVLARIWVVERLKAETSGSKNPIEDIDRRLHAVEKLLRQASLQPRNEKR